MMRLTTRPPSRFSNSFSQQLRIIFKPPNINLLLRIGCKPIKFLYPTTQSDPDSQIALHQAHNTWRSCNAAPSHGRRIGFAIVRVGDQCRMCWFRSSVCPAVIIPEPNQVAILIAHLTWNADLVAVEVVGLLDAFSVFGCPTADLR